MVRHEGAMGLHTLGKSVPRDVPVAVMDALQSSAYNQYKIEDITAIERPDGLFYDFELKQDNNEIHIILDSEAKIVIKSSTIAPGYDW